jgi:hypothetical protein
MKTYGYPPTGSCIVSRHGEEHSGEEWGKAWGEGRGCDGRGRDAV